jgi:hypothetical protein
MDNVTNCIICSRYRLDVEHALQHLKHMVNFKPIHYYEFSIGKRGKDCPVVTSDDSFAVALEMSLDYAAVLGVF